MDSSVADGGREQQTEMCAIDVGMAAHDRVVRRP